MSNPEENSVQKTKKVDEISEADDNKKLFVGGLSWETTKDDLVEYFSQWGEVQCAAVKTDRISGQSRGFGFVVFIEEASVEKTLQVREHRLKNKKIDPKPAKSSLQSSRKIFVGGIDPDVTEEQIREYFGKFGAIESLDLPFDTQRGKRKSYLFITFSTDEGAKEATKVEKQDLFGRKCDVRIAVPPDQAQKARGMNGSHRGGFNAEFAHYHQFASAYGAPQYGAYGAMGQPHQYFPTGDALGGFQDPSGYSAGAYQGGYNTYYYPSAQMGYAQPPPVRGGKIRGGAAGNVYHPYRG